VLALNKMDKQVTSDVWRVTGDEGFHSPSPATRHPEWLVTQDEFEREGNAVRISALKGQGLDELLASVERALREEMVVLRVQIPYSANELAALFHQRGIIDREEFTPQGTHIEGKIAANLAAQFQRYRTDGR
jgi:50S ribosomal subunit-associated GTPase HflX